MIAISPQSQSDATASFPETGRRRVCHVSLTLCTGGLERLLVDFARFHDRRRFEATFVVLGEAGRPADDIRNAGCEVIRFSAGRKGRLARIRELARWFRESEIDVVHTHNAFPHLYGTLAGRWARVPAIVHTRHGRRFGNTYRERLQFMLASRLVDRVVAVSDDTAVLARRMGWLTSGRVDRIWNGIDVERFPYHGGSRQPCAISVARLSPEKDFSTLLRAVALVVRDVPEFRLQLVGDGPERGRLEALADELHLRGCVEFLGERGDVPELLRSAGFFVSSSLTEGISLTLLEAMAVGLPVVTTAVGGNPEIVIPGETGTLVPAGKPETLAAAIRRMCGSHTQWPAMGRAARRRVEEHFAIRGMVAQYERLYDELLGRRAVTGNARRFLSRTGRASWFHQRLRRNS